MSDTYTQIVGLTKQTRIKGRRIRKYVFKIRAPIVFWVYFIQSRVRSGIRMCVCVVRVRASVVCAVVFYVENSWNSL